MKKILYIYIFIINLFIISMVISYSYYKKNIYIPLPRNLSSFNNFSNSKIDNDKPRSHLQYDRNYPLSIISDISKNNINNKDISNKIIKNLSSSSTKRIYPLMNKLKSTDPSEQPIGNSQSSSSSIEEVYKLEDSIDIEELSDTEEIPIVPLAPPLLNFIPLKHEEIFQDILRQIKRYKKDKREGFNQEKKIEQELEENSELLRLEPLKKEDVLFQDLINPINNTISILEFIPPLPDKSQSFPLPPPIELFSDFIPHSSSEPYQKHVPFLSKDSYLISKWNRFALSIKNINSKQKKEKEKEKPKSKVGGIFSSSRRKVKQTYDFDFD